MLSALTRRGVRLLSSRIRHVAEQESIVLRELGKVFEPVTGLPLVSLGMIQNLAIADGSVRFDIDVLVPGYPDLERVRIECEDKLRALEWVKDVQLRHVCSSVGVNGKAGTAAPNGLADVRHVIAVSSCKGGVGKSTVAVNLAYSLTLLGLKVGLLDGDIYGPSIPLMVKPDEPECKIYRSQVNPGFVMPLTAEGLKVLSFGHVNPRAGVVGAGGQGAAVIRGPVATKVINQLAAATDWGALDYLIIDFPPGTGDVPLTLCQSIVLTGAVIVTTPHPLAVVDVAKGMQMFSDLKVPTLSVVQNMTHFTCAHGTVYRPFGAAGKQQMLKYFSLKDSPASNDSHLLDSLTTCPFHEIPFHMAEVSPEVNANLSFKEELQRSLRPIVLSAPASVMARQHSLLAQDCIRQVFRQQASAYSLPSVSYVEGRGVVLRYFTPSRAIEHVLPLKELRQRDPKTGALIRVCYVSFNFFYVCSCSLL